MIKNTKADLEINGTKISADIKIEVIESEHVDLSHWDYEEDRQRIKNGEITVVDVIVRAEAFDLFGLDSISQCAVSSMRGEKFELELEEILSDCKLVENALTDLEKTIKHMAQQLHGILGI